MGQSSKQSRPVALRTCAGLAGRRPEAMMSFRAGGGGHVIVRTLKFHRGGEGGVGGGNG